MLEIARDKRKGLIAFLLRPVLYILSLIYGLCVRLVCAGYLCGILPRYKSQAKVISVGNITLGGTGKTPFVEFLSRHLNRDGRRVVILSRGYGDDEARLLQKNLAGVPVITGRDRIKNARRAEAEFKAEVTILDDGFQHWRLKRDLDIVLVNSADPFGNGMLIPRGILREYIPALKRADIIILTKTDSIDNTGSLVERLKKINPSVLIVESLHEAKYFYDLKGQGFALNIIENKAVCLLSSIADPAYFKKTVLGLGANLALDLEYPDHYRYKTKDLLRALRLCRENKIDTIVTTEKDLMRIPYDVFEEKIEVLILRIELKLTNNEAKLFSRISGIFNG